MFVVSRFGFRAGMLALFASFFFYSGSAFAQPVDPWSSTYFGGNVGYGWANSMTATTNVGGLDQHFPPFDAVFDGGANVARVRPDGVFAGVQAGHNWRMEKNWIAGIETDFQWSDQKGKGLGGFDIPISDSFCDLPTCTATNSAATVVRLNWFGTTRFRAGIEWNNLWLYGTAGLAYGQLRVSGTNTFTMLDTFGAPPTTLAATYASAFRHTQVNFGWTVGAGIEGAISSSPWTWKIEYLYVDLGSVGSSYSLATNPAVTVALGPHATFIDQIVRFGINYHFAALP
jgi:outer membrane immunogenic protein